MNELIKHFSFRPYLDLNIQFDPSEIQTEVTAVSKHLVDRRRFVTSEASQGWSAVALRSFNGDAGSVETEKYYGAPQHDAHEFRWSPIAERCPSTIKLLNRLTRVEACRRIRFMSLAPNGRVPLHRDSESDISLIIYCPIIYPSECLFSMKNKDGELEQVPLKAGSCFLLDISKPHQVLNLSTIARISLVVEGAVTLSLTQLLVLAQMQNGPLRLQDL